MGNRRLEHRSVYEGCCAILTTKHAKSVALAPVFWEVLGMAMLEYPLDTDQLGTFTGEIPRQGNALDCARRKCELGLEILGENAEYGLASEGSFGPHPTMFMIPANQELLYFIDRQRNFHLYLTHISEKTNYQMQTVDTLEALQRFAESAQFPSHALILRPNDKKEDQYIFKGIEKQGDLMAAFKECIKYSSDGKAWVETDMRAQYNPSRMQVINELAHKMAERLASLCPQCNTPGWGKVALEEGLECSQCDSKTALIKTKILGCVKCTFVETKNREDGLTRADPIYCPYCNP